MRNLYLGSRFFYFFAGIILMFIVGFKYYALFILGKVFLVVFTCFVGLDIFWLFQKSNSVIAARQLPKLFSLADENKITIALQNNAARKLSVEVVDELPFQFQVRDHSLHVDLQQGEARAMEYHLKPFKRGEYHFGNLNLFISSILGLVSRRVVVPAEAMIPVYPSILQMKKYEQLAFNSVSMGHGIKKLRRIGRSYEFEQIKTYVPGDDYRSINWKASSRLATLMVNQYEDERSQSVYSIIDKSRNMRMPFDGLSLMDYAVNSALVISNVVLQKNDKAGLLTFSDKIGSAIKADRKTSHLNKILAALYREKPRDLEARYELLYHSARKLIKGRSLLFLYTNFESTYAMERVLPILRKINRLHLLVVVFFTNTEVTKLANKKAKDTEAVYHQTIAKKFISEKQAIAQILRQHKIQTILTDPADLSINSINKYLELKARGLI